MIKQDYARILVEHYNETKPDLLRQLMKENPKDFKLTVDHKVEMAINLAKRYRETTSLNMTEINELVKEYLAPAEELPMEPLNEMSMKEVDGIIKMPYNM